MSKRQELLEERDRLMNQKKEIENQINEILDAITVMDRDIFEEKKKKKLASATHMALRIRDDNRPGPHRVVHVKETATGWTELETGDRYKKSNKSDMSEPLRFGSQWTGTWYRLVDIKEIEK